MLNTATTITYNFKLAQRQMVAYKSSFPINTIKPRRL